jgi:hypothetical protein
VPAEPLHGADHEFLFISPAQPGSLAGVMSFSLAGQSTDPGSYEAGKRSSPDRGDSPHRDNAGRDGIAAGPDVHGRALVGPGAIGARRPAWLPHPGHRRSAIGDRREPASHEPTSPDPLTQLTRLLTNLPGDAPPVFTVAISRHACSSCAWQAS